MVEFRLVSCLKKVFCDEAPISIKYAPEGLRNETAAFQAAFKGVDMDSARIFARLEVESDLGDCVKIERVRCVPVNYAWIPSDDGDWLRTTPGLYPDLLTPIENGRLRVYNDHWESVWISIEPNERTAAGQHPIRLKLLSDSGEALAEAETVYTLMDAVLPEQELIHTRWFHCDGLCNYYGVKMFSEEFWKICEGFVKAAADMSINCLLTPVHTPPLDTQVGGERLTCQLVKIKKMGDKYEFDFALLERWVRMALGAGIKYFEIAHFFTQWGAAHAPKIVAEVDGKEQRIFGWETEAAGKEYSAFLNQYIPALRSELEKLGVLENCFFHISDEPNLEQLESYNKAKETVKDALNGLKVIDALSNIDFYRRGVVTKPVPASDHIKPFLEEKIEGLWTYYCVGQYKYVSNAFIAMPSRRTRVIGTQLFKYDIEGFLQWGFNFYNSQYSEYPINPYVTTDGDGFSPAGDCFIVYPGENGRALPSIRARVFAQGVYDLRALKLLAKYVGKDEALKIMEQGIEPIEFDKYPTDDEWLLDLRHRINGMIEKHARAGH